MNKDECLLKKVKLSDAPALCKSSILKGSVKSAEQMLRSIDCLPFIDSYVCKNDNGDILSLVYINHRDEQKFSCELKISMSSIIPESEKYSSFYLTIKKCLNTAFREGFYKVSIILSQGEEELQKVLSEFGFIQEAILHEEYDFDRDYFEAGLFYLIEPRYKEYNCCFVPFQKGVYVLYGSNEYVDSGRIYSYGDEVFEPIALYMGKYLGILDGDNKLISKGSEEYIFDEEYLESFLPSEVFKGYKELREYFQKERDNFDLNILFESKSDFRLNVWNEIRKITYASTLCYEDIAQILCGNNKDRAKTMVRVVGQACSDCPVPIIIPCHRVIGKDGKLVGYKDGIEFKDFLLIHESFSAIMI